MRPAFLDAAVCTIRSLPRRFTEAAQRQYEDAPTEQLWEEVDEVTHSLPAPRLNLLHKWWILGVARYWAEDVLRTALSAPALRYTGGAICFYSEPK